MEKYKVTFYPENKTIEIGKSKTLLSAAISLGININSGCAGDGVCGRCKVIIKKGQVATLATGRISQEEKKQGLYLACLTTALSDVEVEIPEQSRLDFTKITDEEAFSSRLRGVYTKAESIEKSEPIINEDIFIHSPLATKVYLELPQPTQEDKISDLERLYREIRKIKNIEILQTGLANIRHLGNFLRSADFKITATLGNRNDTTEIVLIEPADTSKNNFGVAFDIGTTTISGQLVDLNTKKVLGTKATFNQQATFGADIITRIIYAQKEEGLERLHHAVIDGMNDMIQELIKENNIDLNNVTCCVCAGNTTMIHLLLRVDPTYIRRDPYVPTANFVPVIRAQEAGIKINPRGLLGCVPGISSYVGGDITSGVLACGMDDEKDLCLLIDVGTNGEIVLGNNEWMISTAASAGPAFEGSGVSCGLRATRGAIQKIKIDKKTFKAELKTIGDAPAKGICGSGYIDLLSEMLKAGVMDKNGKIEDIRNELIREGEFGKEFIIYESGENNKSKIYINEVDIDNLKRAKGAIYSAAACLLRHMGLGFEDVKKIFIAGGFGNYLDIESAITIGLLPDIERSRFKFVGNSSLIGAREVILSSDAIHKTENLAKKITCFELSSDQKYMDEYMAALFFPHTDITKFKNIKL
ncbi:MAG: ferredoxin [Candidatus Omnitrophica bacterium CG11_big_fil_rev_8_21_14_0_20_42_13]|uniref:Ferredoxin n=1 Tax=Candidatus Ghiorseimicrobium undicola TaxID=1974746 RepID=A0A2H0M2N7_9BACT|nr:MAG: ferredoxin [Candidatus Omnitrophica bacterium CG11_big_fil_rev_8_21_14_0_20_42_13]